MNKSELIAAIADQAGVSNKDAGACLDAFCDVVASTVADGGKVAVPGWMSFEHTIRAARTARNPQTGVPIDVPEKAAVKIKAGAKLKSAVASGSAAPGAAVAEEAPAEEAPAAPAW
ncbi:MAG: HU family DNA-binding protein [Acidimicrobiales bacterium]|nr:HU family DNA-binding protein [Acidimicrobiales bacterium]